MKKLILIILLCFPFVVHAEEISLAKNAKSAIMIEASTGEILFEKNSHEKLHPASMTKMMSMLLIMENIENGNLSWDEMVTASSNASSMGGSQILLETNEQMSVEDLFKGIAVASGNDAVVALAERIAGTEEEFVKMMNQKAKELGLKDSNFKNPHGLDDANHYSSSYDMSLIAKELVKHQKVLEFSSIYEDYLRKGTDKELWLVNTNKLVKFYDGVDGLKTGYTKEAGYCLTATAEKNGMRIITVVMGEEDSKIRNSETTEMLNYAFSRYELETLLSTDSSLGKVKIDKSLKDSVTLVPTKNVASLNQKGKPKKNFTYDVETEEIKAPIKKGDIVGKLKIKDDGKTIRTIDITVHEDIKKANYLELYYIYLKNILTGNL